MCSAATTFERDNIIGFETVAGCIVNQIEEQSTFREID